MKDTATHKMFSLIAERYDLLNHVLSFNLDRRWRKTLARSLNGHSAGSAAGGEASSPPLILDACAGTCDIALELARTNGRKQIIAVDLSREMLLIGREKIRQKGMENVVKIVEGDVLVLPFEADTFDVVTIGYGLRNLLLYGEGISEMARVLKPGGRLFILEFGPPGRSTWWKLYRWYLHAVVPSLGGAISGRRGIYRYLSKSIEDFLGEEEVLGIMEDAGLSEVECKRLTGGISLLYRGVKRSVL